MSVPPQDISAKSPIIATDLLPRQSLDSARFPRQPRSALQERRFEREPPTPEEGFEEVGLNDDGKQQSPNQVPAKRRGFFSKFGTDVTTTSPSHDAAPPTHGGGNLQTMSRFLPGRKRGQSGQGAELGAMPVAAGDRPGTATTLQEQEVQS